MTYYDRYAQLTATHKILLHFPSLNSSAAFYRTNVTYTIGVYTGYEIRLSSINRFCLGIFDYLVEGNISISMLAVKFGNYVGGKQVIMQRDIGSVRFDDSLELYSATID
jgi:hypothetical protein